MTFLQTIAVAAIPAFITTAFAYFKLRQDFNMFKTEVMAERAAKKLLNHKGYTDRSFFAIQKELGGWDNEPDELRKILVRAGAVRTFKKTDDKSGEIKNVEWWYLLSRRGERLDKIKSKN